MSDPIRLVLGSPAAELALNAPAKRNALSQAMWRAIPGLVAQAAASPDVKCLIVHGGEAGAFAAGADISEFESVYATPDSAEQSARAIAAALEAIETCPKPVIAAIEGACVGGGVSLAMACDLRVAAAGAKFGVTPGKLGLVYPLADTRRLVQAVGAAATRDILFTARLFGAEEAFRLRLIDRLTDPGAALETAREIAAQMASLSQWSVRASKRMIGHALAGAADDDPEAARLALEGFAGEDFQEGYSAFLAKRPPDFPVK